MITQSLQTSIEDVVTSGLSSIRSPEPMTLSEWAEAHFYLSPESSSIVGTWETIPYQKAIMDAISNDDITVMTWQKSARVGYALALFTPIPTPNGWTTMGELSAGDKVFDENGKQCNVITKSEIFTDHDCYRITFDDGTTVIADGDHRWKVQSRTTLRDIDSSRFKYHCKEGVLSTSEIFEHQKYKRIDETNDRCRFSIQTSSPIECEPVESPIDPYWLGLWLGDGSSASSDICVGKEDICSVLGLAEADGYINRVYNTDVHGNFRFNVEPLIAGGDGSSFHRKLRTIGVIKNKHVPSYIMRGSHSQRLRLLQGLMDSDGTIDKRGRCEFYNTDINLIDAVRELAVSLGMKAYLRVKEQLGILPNGNYAKTMKRMYAVNFLPNAGLPVFRLPRKLSRQIKTTSILKRRVIISVENVDIVPVQCISVDSESSLFLATKSFIPTHNTKILVAAMGYFAEHKQRSQVIWQPTDTDGKDFVKDEVDPMLRDVVVVRAILKSSPDKRSSENTIAKKMFHGSTLDIRGGKSATNYRRLTKDVCIYDELDGFDNDVDGEGSPTSLGDVRMTTSSFPKSIRGSTPKTKDSSLIAASLNEADMVFKFHVPCPHCEEHQILRWGSPDSDHGIKWVDSDSSTAKYLCEHCAVLIEYRDLPDMLDDGFWADENGNWIDSEGDFFDQEHNPIDAPNHIGFHIWAAYSIFKSWKKIADDFMNAMKSVKQGDNAKLKSFVNTTLGETWEEMGSRPESENLMMRRENYHAKVPQGGLGLYCGVDVQDDRIEAEVIAYGEGDEQWAIDVMILHGDPSQPIIWRKLDEFLLRTYDHESGATLKLSATIIDTGYLTKEVYEFCKTRTNRGVYAGKGSSTPGAPVVNKPTRSNIAKVPLFSIGTDTIKEHIYGKLGCLIPGPGYCHFPIQPWCEEEYFAQLTAEKCVTKLNNKGFSSKVWIKTRPRNEVLDRHVYAYAARIIHNPSFKNLQMLLDPVIKGDKKRLIKKVPKKPSQSDDWINTGDRW